MDRAWLGRRIEEPLDPDLEIVDPHHHLWPAGSRYGRYGLDDLLINTAAGHRIVQTVFVECRSSYLEDGPWAARSESADLTVGTTRSGNTCGTNCRPWPS